MVSRIAEQRPAVGRTSRGGQERGEDTRSAEVTGISRRDVTFAIRRRGAHIQSAAIACVELRASSGASRSFVIDRAPRGQIPSAKSRRVRAAPSRSDAQGDFLGCVEAFRAVITEPLIDNAQGSIIATTRGRSRGLPIYSGQHSFDSLPTRKGASFYATTCSGNTNSGPIGNVVLE